MNIFDWSLEFCKHFENKAFSYYLYKNSLPLEVYPVDIPVDGIKGKLCGGHIMWQKRGLLTVHIHLWRQVNFY